MRWGKVAGAIGFALLVARLSTAAPPHGRGPAIAVASATTATGPDPFAVAPTPTCAAQLPGGRWPSVPPAMAAGAHVLCAGGFTSAWSPATRTPIFSSEILDGARVAASRADGAREGPEPFHADRTVPAGEGAEPADYRGGGFDRGHMTPFGDIPPGEARYDSFDLPANVVPQDRDSNRGLWEGIEIAVRGLATHEGPITVVTGPVFDGPSYRALRGRVMIPTRLWKAVWGPTIGAGAYLADNAPGTSYRIVSDAELAREVGVDPFPWLDAATRSRPAALPPPRPYGRHG